MKYKLVLKKNIKNVLNRILVTLIFILLLLIINKSNPNFVKKIKNSLYNKSINFIKINKLSKKIIGKEVFYYQNNSDSLKVINSDIELNTVHKYFDGESFKVSKDLPIGTIESGIVVFIGNKDNYHNTVIVQGTDGYNIWYGNLKDINTSLYSYVEKNSLIGSADGEEIYLLIEKDNKLYTYEEYKKN